ncbi:MAG: M14 metallopeptidase family protein [Bacteroidota bacterium]
MRNRLLLFGLIVCTTFRLHAQSVPSPQEFLGYELGSTFTWHHQVVDYFETISEASPQVQLIPYGTSYEGRPLMVAVVSQEQHLQRLEEIRTNNLKHTGLLEGEPNGSSLPIVWLSYNIHGNESVSSEAAMQILHELVTNDTANWLSEVVVILDPCLNPDGRERYVNWYKQARNRTPNVAGNSWEHREPWPGGRYNHYLFDLNRDWCWQTQQESQQRTKLYHQWMPQVHVDFHEMGPNSPYYFGPAARPYHEVINQWQREFQEIVGKNHARYFDANGWFYFTKETYDLLYPSYGDTWPTFQGAIGFTYEQGGSGRAGLGLKIASGDTLRLSDRMAHHYTTSLSTIEASFHQREKLLKQFQAYFETAQQNPPGPYKTFVVKASNPGRRVEGLLKLLEGNQIRYDRVGQGGKSVRGFAYQSNQNNSSYQLQTGDVVISAYQPQGNLVKVLFEPVTQLEDSLTYDLTAWSLPYAFDLDAIASTEKLSIEPGEMAPEFVANEPTTTPSYAYLMHWEDVSDVKFLAALHQQKIKARHTTKSFEVGGKRFPRGSLVIARAENEKKSFDEKVLKLANEHQKILFAAPTGFADDGKDLGSNTVEYLKQPKIALVNGPGVVPASFGEMWHYFEREIEYPVTVLHTDYLSSISLAAYDVVILCSGNYRKFEKQLMLYAGQGGNIIALESAIGTFTKGGDKEKPPTALAGAWSKQEKARKEAEKKEKENNQNMFRRFEDRERARLSEFVAGSIYEVALDPTHPIAYGTDSTYFSLKRNRIVYPYLPKEALNVGVIKADQPVNGFTGHKLRKRLKGSMVIGVERKGSGNIVYFADSPIFRGFWHGGKLLLGNAVFLL